MKKLIFIGIAALCASCSSDSSDEPVVPPAYQEGAVQIQTRVDEGTVIAEVNAGLYMVNYVEGEPGNLKTTANYVNNQLLTFADGAWSTSQTIYWKDIVTPADFYAYAPFQSNVTDARAMSFSVQKDQRTLEAVAQSDFLWGTLQEQSPTASDLGLKVSHMLSQLTVKVVTDGNFTEPIKPEDVAITIGGTKTAAKIDLATGMATPVGGAVDVKCYSNGDLSYTAILIPQQVPFSNLIQIMWKDNPFVVQNAFKLESKKRYTLTVKLRNIEGGFNVGIGGWDIVEEDFGGRVGGG